MKEIIIGIDLGGTKLSVSSFELLPEYSSQQFSSSYERQSAIINFLSLIKTEKFNFNTDIISISKGQNKFKEKEKFIENKIDEMIRLTTRDIKDFKIIGIGIASAGFIEGNTIINATNIGIKNYKIKEIIERKYDVEVILMKDSWAPVYAVDIKEPTIIFSIGTGFGGVSCESDREIKIFSKTLKKFPTWIPLLRFNDDPGYACSFSKDDFVDALKTSLTLIQKTHSNESKDIELCFKTNINSIYENIFKYAKSLKKITPSKIELKIASVIAPEAIKNIKVSEIFPDFFCSADFVFLIYNKLLKIIKNLSSKFKNFKEVNSSAEIDKKLINADELAILCFTLQGVFLGKIINLMQVERKKMNLPYVKKIYGTGSGYNTKNYKVIQDAIIFTLRNINNFDLNEYPDIKEIPVIKSKFEDTTLASFGAACRSAVIK